MLNEDVFINLLLNICCVCLLFPIYRAIAESILNKNNSLDFRIQMIVCFILISFSIGHMLKINL